MLLSAERPIVQHEIPPPSCAVGLVNQCLDGIGTVERCITHTGVYQHDVFERMACMNSLLDACSGQSV